jgi:D-lactate dehydrogenase
MQPHKMDYQALPAEYRRFFDNVRHFISEDRLIIDPLRTLAYGTDASFYRLNPKMVIKARSLEEVSGLLKLAGAEKIPVTFRTAGTSLSGQAVSDSVLVLLAGGWRGFKILNEGHRIALEPGVIGASANQFLARYGRKIGPDPASIATAMIGGIAANNASGMCCGTSENSYKTVESMKVILADGSLLDTGDPSSRDRFMQTHATLLAELTKIREEILRDPELENRIREKYRIKNTTGYGLNSLVDYADPIDILLHLMIGSEGTLGFIAEITYRTVVEHVHKASALVIFPDIHRAGIATQMLARSKKASAVEMMDRASLRSVENKKGMPAILKTLSESAAALLVETRAGSQAELDDQIRFLEALLSEVETVSPVQFTAVKAEYETFWDIRRGLFPAVGAARKTGTTVVIEDVAFKIEQFADATVDLQNLLRKHGYHEGIIFGHALDGNVHFVFTQNFDEPTEVTRYQAFMDEVTELVVKKYDGALKAEHGTGRNIAPFVEAEWGTKAHGLMKRIKRAFDPDGILNPGVIITEKPNSHLDNLKALPAAHEIVDKCIECGFCEPKCPSKELTLSPRQRTVLQREISALKRSLGRSGENPDRLKRLEDDYEYMGNDTCATCGLCATSCPVGIDTGKFTKHLRAEQKSPIEKGRAQFLADHYSLFVRGARTALTAASFARAVLGSSGLKLVSDGLHATVGTPQWIPEIPKKPKLPSFRDTSYGFAQKVVYFPSCISRSMGPAASDPDQRSIPDVTLSVLKKAGFDVIFPQSLGKLCCGLTFDSKGFPEQAAQKLKELETELLACSENGRYPILSDTSPCTYRMKGGLDPRLKLYDTVEFAFEFLLKSLELHPVDETIAVHVTCSSTKLGLAEKFKAVAQACAKNVVMPTDVGCCGFAGDKGFTHPELNESALRSLKASVSKPECACSSGYSNSRGCEVGLSHHSGIPYQSIMYLLDRASVRQ